MLRLATPNQFQLRLGWLRVIARLLGGTEERLPVPVLMARLADAAQEQDAWLDGVSAPTGRYSPRAARELVRMAEAYGLYSPETGRPTGLGLVICALDFDHGTTANPMLWPPGLDLFGFRLVMQTNGSILLPLLRGWDDSEVPRDALLRSLAQCRLSAPPEDQERLDGLLQRVSDVAPDRLKPSIVQPLLEPLRDLDLLVPARERYQLTERGARLRSALRDVLDLEGFFRNALATVWAVACDRPVVTPTEVELLQAWQELPPGLRGGDPAAVPWPCFTSWMQARLAASRSSCVLEEEDLDRRIRAMAARVPERIRFRRGDFAGERDLMWDESLFDAQPVESAGEPAPRQADPAVSSPTEAPAETTAHEAPMPAPRRLVGWQRRVLRLLDGGVGLTHGGPATWIRTLLRELDEVPAGVIEKRRKGAAYPDADFKPKLGYSAHTAFLGEVRTWCADWPQADALVDLVDRWTSVNTVDVAQLRYCLAVAESELPAFRRRVADWLRDWLVADEPFGDDHLPRVEAFTCWLVDDAVTVCGEGAATLRRLVWLQSPSELLEALANVSLTTWQASAVVRADAAAQEAPRLGSLLTSESFSLPPGVVLGRLPRDPDTVVFHFEHTLEAASREQAQHAAEGACEKALARLDFVLRLVVPSVAISMVMPLEVAPDAEPLPEGVTTEVPETPESLGIMGEAVTMPEWEDSRLDRTLVLLRLSRASDQPAALQLAHLWAAVEHLVAADDVTKGPEVIRAFSLAAAWQHATVQAGVRLRDVLAALHRAVFLPAHRQQALDLLEIVLPGQRARYEAVPDAIFQPYQALFGRPLIVNDHEARTILCRLGSSSPAVLPRLADFLDPHDPWLAGAVRSDFLRYKNIAGFRDALGADRRAIAGLLAMTYEIRNRVVHEADLADGDSMPARLAQRVRSVLEPVVADLLRDGDVAGAFARWRELSERLTEHRRVASAWYERLAARWAR